MNLWCAQREQPQIGQNFKAFFHTSQNLFCQVSIPVVQSPLEIYAKKSLYVAAGAAKALRSSGGSRGAAPPLRIPYNLKIPQKNQFLQFNSIFLESMIYRKYSKKWIWWRSKLLAQYLKIIQKIQFLQIKSNLNEKKCRISFRKFA